MELRQLRYFQAVATLGGFRRAADELSIAQPAISQQIRRLELQLGVTLFERATRPVTLTTAGRHLLDHAERLLADADTIESDMRQFSPQGGNRLAVGAMQYLTFLELPEVLLRFRQAHPGIEVTVNIGNTGELEALLHHGEIDIAIAHVGDQRRPAGLRVQSLRREELVLLVSTTHPFAGRSRIDIGELVDAPFVVSRLGGLVRETFETFAVARGFTPKVAFETADMATTITLVSRNLGVATVPRSLTAIEENVAAIPLGPDAPMLTLSLLRAEKRSESFASAAFARYAQAAFRDL